MTVASYRTKTINQTRGNYNDIVPSITDVQWENSKKFETTVTLNKTMTSNETRGNFNDIFPSITGL